MNSAAQEIVMEAFRRRLASVCEIRPGGLRAIEPIAADDPEEVLRKLMIVLLPRIAQSTDEEALLLASSLLLAVEAHARSDMRFLDAFNCYYEKTDTTRWRAHAVREAVVDVYKKVLLSFLDRVDGGVLPTIAEATSAHCHEVLQPSEVVPRRVLVLADHVYGAARIVGALRRVPCVEVSVLICNNRHSLLAFFLRQAAGFLRSLQAHRINLWRILKHASWRLTAQPVHSESVLKWIRQGDFDIGLHGMGVIYRRKLLSAFRLGVLNAHIGYLPTFRGRCVLEWSLLAGHSPAITVFFIDEGIDTGERIVLARRMDPPFPNTLEEFRRQMFVSDGDAYAAALYEMQKEEFAFLKNTVSQGRRYYVVSELLRSVVMTLLTRQRTSRSYDGERRHAA